MKNPRSQIFSNIVLFIFFCSLQLSTSQTLDLPNSYTPFSIFTQQPYFLHLSLDNVKEPQTSYHESLDHCLYIPGVGHVAPDTYSVYGSLLDSDDDDDTQVTSAYYGDENTLVPDSLIEEVSDCDQKHGVCVDACGVNKGISLERGRSGDLSTSSRKFRRFCDNFLEKRRKKEEKRGISDNVKEEKGISGESCRSVDLSPKSKRFKRFCSKYSENWKKKNANKGGSFLFPLFRLLFLFS